MPATRTNIEFPSQGTTCRGWWFQPETPATTPNACIVMAHGLGGVIEAGLEPYARVFADAGFHVLVFDYRHFGHSNGEPRQLLSISKQLDDWAAAISFARQQPGIDPGKIALWGSSFSGGHVVVAAARDGKVAAVSSQGPMMDGRAAVLNVIGYAGLGRILKLSGLGVMDEVKALFGMEPVYIPLVAPPGQMAAMSTEDAEPGFKAIAPPDWRNEAAARLALSLAFYRPINDARKLPCKLLILACTHDSVAPVSAAEATARKAAKGADLKHYDMGHFDIYVGEGFKRSSGDQLAFFRRELLGA
ncbi:alpha/beta fold hydrolase [Marinobacteraceae bacterium S3BR75-40.1]